MTLKIIFIVLHLFGIRNIITVSVRGIVMKFLTNFVVKVSKVILV